MNEKSEIDKLRILLPHWIEHNKSHGKEFKKWAKAAREKGHSETADQIEKAITKIAEADHALIHALEKIGGSLNGHSHDHKNGHNH